jgi:uncharacterized membrane protein YfcA
VADARPWLLAVVVLAGVAGGFANVVAGGGSLVTVPALILVGVPESMANGTSRLGIVLQNVVAVLRYRAAGVLPSRLLSLVAPTLLGAAAGAAVAVWVVPGGGFRRIFGGVMLFWAAVIAARADAFLARGRRRDLPPWFVFVLLFAIGIYGGFVQAAAGYLLLALFTLGMGLPLKEANILKVALICAYMPVAFVIFVATGNVDWVLGLILSAGQVVGAWLGAGVVMGGGVLVVRVVLVAVVALGALELLGIL